MAFSIRKVTAGSVNMTKAFMKVVVLGVVMFHCFIIEKVYCHQSRVLRRKPITLACESKGSNKCYCPQNYYSDKNEKGKICKLCDRRNYGHGSREDRPYTKKDEAYVDESNCCNGLKDFKKCQTQKGCENALKKLKDTDDNHYSKDIELTGTQYTVTNTDLSKRRRRLLSNRAGRMC